MHYRLRLGAGLIPLLAAAVVHAQCSVSSDPSATARPLNAAIQADADAIISMSLLPKLMHIDYVAAAKTPACDLGQVISGNGAYELWGDDAAGPQRKGLPAKEGDPIALVLPVTDILKALEVSKAGKAATVEGYLLATVSKTDFTGWRFYTAMPDTMTLKIDTAAVLIGGMNPVFRNDADGKTTLFMPKN